MKIMFNQILRLLLVIVALQVGTVIIYGQQSRDGCRWKGQPAEWVLSRRLPATKLSGLLGSTVIPFLNSQGLPVSFISKVSGDSSVRLSISNGSTLREALEDIVRQAPGYKFEVVGQSIIIYPEGEAYNTPITIDVERGVTRAIALHHILRALKGRTEALQHLSMPIFRGLGGETIYGDDVDIGGTHPIIEHLLSLIQKRPSATFEILLTRDGHLYFDFNRVILVQKVSLLGPSKVKVGQTFSVSPRGVLSDGTVVALEGPNCYVKYAVTDNGVLVIDDTGQVVAEKAGLGTISIKYGDSIAWLDVNVM
jgi:hypothetical protein